MKSAAWLLTVLAGGWIGLGALLATGLEETGQPGPGLASDVDFVRDIKPIFEQHCLKCHGPKEEKTFRIDDRDATVDSYVEVGDAEASTLYECLVSTDEEVQMPPPGENDPLTPSEIGLIKAWINEGAKWPDDVKFVAPEDQAAIQEPDQPATGSEPSADTSKQGEAGGSGAETVDQTPAESPPLPDPATAAPKPTLRQVWLALGPLHPALVHLPIGLLCGAGLFALFGLRGNFVMSDCAYYCLWLGTLGCILASVVGWPYAINGGYGGKVEDLFDTEKPVFLHRISGLGATIAALLLALYASAKRASDPDDGLVWKLGAILLAVGIGFVGHSGGELQYGKDHYKQLFHVIRDTTGWDPTGLGPVPAAEPVTPPAVTEPPATGASQLP